MAADGVDLTHVRFEGTPGAPAPRSVRRRGALPVRTKLGSTSAPREPGPGGDFARWVLWQAGVRADAYRSAVLERRVAACLRALKVTSLDAARARLLRSPALVGVAASSLLIGVTSFMRDADVFEGVRCCVLPDLRRRPGPLRIWSAACATGPELYSMAILLAEEGLLERAVLVGTDCRPEAITAAQSPVYSSVEVEGLPPSIRSRHFEAIRGGWRPVQRLRARTSWKVCDVSRSAEDGPWDVILSRNLAIYLTTRGASDLVSRLAAALRPGGWLIVGKAERPAAGTGLVAVSRCIYRKGRSDE